MGVSAVVAAVADSVASVTVADVLTGAAVGGLVSGVTGGDILQGAAMGGLGGAVGDIAGNLYGQAANALAPATTVSGAIPTASDIGAGFGYGTEAAGAGAISGVPSALDIGAGFGANAAATGLNLSPALGGISGITSGFDSATGAQIPSTAASATPLGGTVGGGPNLTSALQSSNVLGPGPISGFNNAPVSGVSGTPAETAISSTPSPAVSSFAPTPSPLAPESLSADTGASTDAITGAKTATATETATPLAPTVSTSVPSITKEADVTAKDLGAGFGTTGQNAGAIDLGGAKPPSIPQVGATPPPPTEPSFLGELGTGIKKQIANNALTLGLGAYSMLNQPKLPASLGTPTAANASTTIAANAAQAGQTGQQLLTAAKEGTVTPGQQAALNLWASNAKATVKDYYAKQGLSNSSMEASALNNIDQQVAAQMEQIVQQNITQGLAALGSSNTANTAIANAQIANNTAVQNMMTNLAKATGSAAGQASNPTGTSGATGTATA